MSSPSVSRSTSEGGVPRPFRLALGFIAVWAVAGCAVFGQLGDFGAAPRVAETGPPPGPAFDHEAHLEKGLECIDCHEGAEDDELDIMPDLEFCMECHEEFDEEKPPQKRASAWVKEKDGDPEWRRSEAFSDAIVFSHIPHVAGAELDCTECHEGIEEATYYRRDQWMSMAACMKCHEEQQAPNDCALCHPTIGPDQKPDNHDRLWGTLHGQIARQDDPQTLSEDCSLCHSQNECTTCHRAEAPRDHLQSWRRGGGHGIAAALDRTRCQTCHEVQSCDSCHQTARPRSHRSMWGSPRSTHCYGCHEPVSSQGCGVCHRGTPSHDAAPRQPSWHTPDMQCRQCHTPLRHADDGTSCNRCHR
jgi:cytochrome c3-like protein